MSKEDWKALEQREAALEPEERASGARPARPAGVWWRSPVARTAPPSETPTARTGSNAGDRSSPPGQGPGRVPRCTERGRQPRGSDPPPRVLPGAAKRQRQRLPGQARRRDARDAPGPRKDRDAMPGVSDPVLPAPGHTARATVPREPTPDELKTKERDARAGPQPAGPGFDLGPFGCPDERPRGDRRRHDPRTRPRRAGRRARGAREIQVDQRDLRARPPRAQGRRARLPEHRPGQGPAARRAPRVGARRAHGEARARPDHPAPARGSRRSSGSRPETPRLRRPGTHS